MAVDNPRAVDTLRRVVITPPVYDEVVPHEQLLALPEFQKLKEAGKPSPVEDEKFSGHGGWTFSPCGLPVAFDSEDEESFMQSNKDPDPRGEQYRCGGSLFSATPPRRAGPSGASPRRWMRTC